LDTGDNGTNGKVVSKNLKENGMTQRGMYWY